MNRRFYQFNLNELLLKKEKYLPNELIKLKNYPNLDLHRLVNINDSLLIGTGFFSNGRYVLLNENTNTCDYQFGYPSLDKNNDIIKSEVYQALIRKKPDNSGLALISARGAIFEINEIMRNKLMKIQDKHYFIPEYSVEQNDIYYNIIEKANAKNGFVSISVTNDYIYLLYSGRIPETDKNFMYGNYILAFDWKGKEIKKYILNQDLFKICVDSKNKSIYAIDFSTKPKIIKFYI